MFFPTLYSKSSTGKILVWKIEVHDDSYRTHAGQQDGKIVVSEWSRCEAKSIGRSNATRPDQQAELEAEALWKKKIKSHGYWQDIADVDKLTFIEPMLAKKYTDMKDKIDFSKGLIIQNKFNGIRCVATSKGLFSRKGERFVSIPHIEQSFKKFFEDNPNAVLDGELFNNDYRQSLNEIVKLCRKTVNVSQDDLERSEELIKYYVYDGYGFSSDEFILDQKTSYLIRKKFINNNLPR